MQRLVCLPSFPLINDTRSKGSKSVPWPFYLSWRWGGVGRDPRPFTWGRIILAPGSSFLSDRIILAVGCSDHWGQIQPFTYKAVKAENILRSVLRSDDPSPRMILALGSSSFLVNGPKAIDVVTTLWTLVLLDDLVPRSHRDYFWCLFVIKSTVLGDWYFDNLSGSHFKSIGR